MSKGMLASPVNGKLVSVSSRSREGDKSAPALVLLHGLETSVFR